MDSSLQMNGGNPVVSYYSNAGFRVATCTSGCGTATPSWAISTVDETTGNTAFYSSLQLVAGRPVAAYFDRANGDLKLATCTANCASSSASWVVTTVGRHR
jgi:hypothetical protein